LGKFIPSEAKKQRRQKMRNFRSIIVLIVIGIFCIQVPCYAQFKWFKREKKSATPAEIKVQIEKLMSSDEEERNRAIEVLGDMGENAGSAIPFLIATLSVKRETERAEAAEKRRSLAAKALAKITGKDFGEDRSQWEQWWEENESAKPGKPKRRVARQERLMKNIPEGTPGDVQEQIRKLFSPNPADQTLAARRIGEMGKRAAVAIPFLIGIMVVKKVADEGGIDEVIDSIKCSEAAKALEQLTGKDFGCKPDTWQEWWEQNKGKILKEALKKKR
jgi:hypothetical protein